MLKRSHSDSSLPSLFDKKRELSNFISLYTQRRDHALKELEAIEAITFLKFGIAPNKTKSQARSEIELQLDQWENNASILPELPALIGAYYQSLEEPFHRARILLEALIVFRNEASAFQKFALTIIDKHGEQRNNFFTACLLEIDKVYRLAIDLYGIFEQLFVIAYPLGLTEVKPPIECETNSPSISATNYSI